MNVFNLFKTKDSRFLNFTRAWDGKVYSVATAQLIFSDKTYRLYKHSSGDYFIVWEALYEDFGYKIFNKRKKVIAWLTDQIGSNNANHIATILKEEFDFTLKV